MLRPTICARLVALAALLPLAIAFSACTSPPAAKVATDTVPVTHRQNDRVPEGAVWTQHYFPSPVPSLDGTEVELHADVLLPEGLADGKQVPVILSVGSYFGHSGEQHVEDWKHTGPSDRFSDLFEGADLFAQGYAFVMVDLRGFGGSSGCLDFMGAGERADIEAAIQWAASQSWSTGAVGMYGKSYEAIAGLVANNLDQDALKAVVAQEPIWDLYRNAWSNGVPRAPLIQVATTYNTIATLPQMPDDDPRYLRNATFELAHGECTVINSLGYQPTADSEYWRLRDLAAQAKDTDTPLFFTQGLLEWNTEPEAIEEFLANHQGQQRGWIGPWDHWRGNDATEDGRLRMGREGWFDEVMSFYDEHLKDIQPSTAYPAFAVQDNMGAWRAEDTWPTSDSAVTITLPDASYLDDGAQGDQTVETGNSYLSWSEPIVQATRITGTPRLSFNAGGNGNVMVRLYDAAPDGTAVMFDEQVALVRGGELAFDLKSTDWTLVPDHRLAVEIGTVQTATPLALDRDDWIDSPSNMTIDINNARLDLAVDDPAGDEATEGDPAVYLEAYFGKFTSQLSIGTSAFALPAARD